MNTLIFLGCLACLMFALCVATETNLENVEKGKSKIKRKSTKDWSKTNFDSIEKEWESSDDKFETEHEFEIQQRINQKHSPFAGVNLDNPSEVKKVMNGDPFKFMAGSGTKMVFVELLDKQLDGKPWDKPAVDKLAARWQALCRSGSTQASFYNIEQNRLLISVDKSYMFGDAMKFVLNQPETLKITIDSKDYLASDYRSSEDDL